MLSRLDLLSRSKQTTHWELCNSGRSSRTVGDIRWLSRAGCESGRAEARPAAAATTPGPRRTHAGRSPACTRSGKGVHVLCPSSAPSTADPRSAVETRLVVLCGRTALFWSSLQEYPGKSACPKSTAFPGCPKLGRELCKCSPPLYQTFAGRCANITISFRWQESSRRPCCGRSHRHTAEQPELWSRGKAAQHGQQRGELGVVLSSAATCGVLRPCTPPCYLPVSPAPEQKLW